MDLEILGWDASWSHEWAQVPGVETEGLLPGRVALQDRGVYGLFAAAGELRAEVSGRLRHEAKGPADYPSTGDWVAYRPGELGQATIHSILPRRSVFSRKAAGSRTEEQVVAANIDTLFLVCGLNEDFNLRRIERTLALASESGARAILLLNKSDLCADPQDRARLAESVARGAPVHLLSGLRGEGLHAIEPWLSRGQTVALVGSSGVGKSTLVNRLLGGTQQATRPLRSDGRGRHTTTRRELLMLPSGGCIIDTPGLREIQLWAEGVGVETVFDDVGELAATCRFRDCRHHSEPGCAVVLASQEGRLPAERLESFHKLERELQALAARKDDQVRRATQARVRSVHKLQKRLKRRDF